MVRLVGILILTLMVAMSTAQEYATEPIPAKFNGHSFAPAYYQQGLVVCSNQKDRLTKTILDNSGEEPLDLYYVDLSNNENPVRFDEHFRTDYHDGPISFTKNGDMCVISRNHVVNQTNKALERDSNKLGLFISQLTEFGWLDMEPWEYNDPLFNTTHPHIDESGNTIWFASDRPGGYGGYDIWTSSKVDGQWTEPVNLGPSVNTQNNEVFPYVLAFELYFASDRPGLGGLDVYTISLIGAGSVRILPEPINSSFDDFGLITKDNLQSGYMSTNRLGMDEVWSFEFVHPTFENCDSLIETIFCYTLYEENAKEIGGVESLIYEWTINDDKRRGIEIDYCFPGPGDYEITLDIIDTIIGKTYFNEAYYFITLEREVQPYITSPDTVIPGQQFELNASNTNLPGVIIDQYYWDFGDGAKAIKEVNTHSYTTPGIYTVQLGVIGYQAEMEIRDCVYKTIVCQGDEIEPLTTDYINLLPDQINDSSIVSDVQYYYASPTDSGFTVYSVEIVRSDTILTETSINMDELDSYDVQLEYIEEEDIYVYLVGQWGDVTDAHSTWREMIELGYDDALVRSIVVDEIDDIPLDEVFVLNHVQFDSDKWDIRSDAIPDLNKVINILKDYSHLTVTIHAHTDATASFEHNLQLSNDRAESVKDYMINAGISADRIKAQGFGETQPIDTNETEEGKQNNRRVEFILVKD